MDSWEVFVIVKIRFVDLEPLIKLQPLARALSIARPTRSKVVSRHINHTHESLSNLTIVFIFMNSKNPLNNEISSCHRDKVTTF